MICLKNMNGVSEILNLDNDFQKALNIAVQNGIEYTEKEIIVGNWKFLFLEPREGFKNSVVYHAVFTGFRGGLEL